MRRAIGQLETDVRHARAARRLLRLVSLVLPAEQRRMVRDLRSREEPWASPFG